jgi:hypothetical protein
MEKELNNDKDVKVKGVQTDEPVKPQPTYKITLPKSSVAYREPKNKEDEWLQKLGNVTSMASNTAVRGTNFTLTPSVSQLYTPVDIAKAIPDGNEREEYIRQHGSNMVNLLDVNKYGIKFDSQAGDFAKFKQKQYDTHVKKFLDDLNENQGFVEEAATFASKLVGKTALAISSLIPTVYGLGKGLFTWDAKNIFNNGLFDAWETADKFIDNHLVVYGGSDYHEGDKNFFARMWSNPMKSLNDDVAPAAAFVAGAVGTELVAAALAPVTGGTSLLANTARLSAMGTRMFANTSRVGKGLKILRGIDKVQDFNEGRKIVELTSKYRNALGTTTSMIRSAGYESSLIARDTYERTLSDFTAKRNDIRATELRAQGKAEEEIQQYLEANPITGAELERYKKHAEDAAETAWFTNIPLVGFSNMMQFPKIFAGGYKLNKSLSKLSPLYGTTMKEGKFVAKAELLNPWTKKALIGGTLLKKGVTEGFEEFAQGVIENGAADYMTSKYTEGAMDKSASWITSTMKAARNYANSVEGQDSMTIGFLMGMLGIRLPVKIDEKTGKMKFSLKGQAFGGVKEEYKDIKTRLAKDVATAEAVNNNPLSPELKANFENMIQNLTIQSQMDDAEAKNNVFEFKNKEHEQYHSFVANRIKLDAQDTIFQELDSYEKLPLDKFNEQFATKQVNEFTEETRKIALDKARETTKNIIDAHQEINTLFEDERVGVDYLRKHKGLLAKEEVVEGVKYQMAYLHSATKNLQKREAELEAQVKEASKGHVNPGIVNELATKITSINTKDKGSVEFASQAKELYNETLLEWRKTDPTSYNLYKHQVAPLLKDLIKIKERKAQTAELYSSLFTKKGFENFAELYETLENNYTETVINKIKEQHAEAVKKTKSSEAAAKNRADAVSIGDTTAVDNKLKSEEDFLKEATRQALEEDGISTGDVQTDIVLTDAAKILDILDKAPNVFNILKDRLAEKGINVGSSLEDAKQMMVETPSIQNAIIDEFALMQKEKQENAPPSSKHLEFAVDSDSTQPNPNPQELTEEELFAQETALLSKGKFTAGTNVTESSIIGVTHDKVIVGKKVKRDPKTGKFVKRDTDQPVNRATINDPDFLNNKTLEEQLAFAEFRVEETIPWKDAKGNIVEITDENVRIGVYHNGEFIMDLPAYKEGMPNNFLALRKAVINQNKAVSEPTVTPTTTTTTNIEAKKAEITKLEKQKTDLLTQSNNSQKITAKTPSKVSVYLASPNKDGSFNKFSERTSFVEGSSIMAFEPLGNNKFAVYIDTKNPSAVKLALQYKDKRIDPTFEGISAFNPQATSIQIVKPAIVELQGDKYILVEKGKIDYDNIGINKENAKTENLNTTEIDSKIAKAKEELATLETPVVSAKKADIERRSRVADIITSQLELGATLPEILDKLAEQGYVEKINNSAFFKQSAGRDAIVFNIDGAIVPVYRSSEGTSSKTKGEWYPFFFNGGDWLVKAGANTYKNGYNNPIIKQILDSLNKNYKYDKPLAKVEGNNEQLLSLLPLKGLDIDVSFENNSGIYDFKNYVAIAIILKDWQSKLGTIDVSGYQDYLDGASSSLIKTNPTLKSEIEKAFKSASDIFAELDALKSTQPNIEDNIILAGLNGAFQAVSYTAFDVRNDDKISQKIFKKESFATTTIRNGKKYIVVGLRLKQDVGATTAGRDGYTFAIIEDTGNLPSNIVDILTQKAVTNISDIYSNIKNSTLEDFKEINIDADLQSVESLQQQIADARAKEQVENAVIEKQIQELEKETKTITPELDFKGEKQYYRTATNDGTFREELKANSQEDMSIAKITVNENNPNEGMIEIVANEQYSLVLATHSDYITVFADWGDSKNNFVKGTKIKTIRKGLVKKVDGEWVKVKEPVVVFGEITQELKEEYGNKGKDNSKEISVLKTKLADIYKKYDKIISPLLKQLEASKPTENAIDKNFDTIIQQLENSGLFENSQKQFKQCK